MLTKALNLEVEDKISASFVNLGVRGQSPWDHQHEHVPVARSRTQPREVAMPLARGPSPGKSPGIPKHGRRDPSIPHSVGQYAG